MEKDQSNNIYNCALVCKERRVSFHRLCLELIGLNKVIACLYVVFFAQIKHILSNKNVIDWDILRTRVCMDDVHACVSIFLIPSGGIEL